MKATFLLHLKLTTASLNNFSVQDYLKKYMVYIQEKQDYSRFSIVYTSKKNNFQ